MFHVRSLRLVSIVAFVALMLVPAFSFAPSISFGPSVSPASADLLAVYHGDIASDAQYDLYELDLRANAGIVATLVCDVGPGGRTLDPILTVYFPGSDPSNTAYSDVYNDDGFGLDDDPAGVDCNAFDSSRVIFVTPSAGRYIFRADGFSTATGPYTLTITDGSGCDALLPINDTSVVGAFVADTPVYSEPGVVTEPPIIITAGKTYWVQGVDPSGQYYAIFVACSRVWVPVSTMGPNYDAVWQGRPLPSTVIQPEGEK